MEEETEVAKAVRTLSEAFKADPDFAHTWHCNIAMACYDSLMEGHQEAHRVGNEAATRFMKLAFDVDTSSTR